MLDALRTAHRELAPLARCAGGAASAAPASRSWSWPRRRTAQRSTPRCASAPRRGSRPRCACARRTSATPRSRRSRRRCVDAFLEPYRSESVALDTLEALESRRDGLRSLSNDVKDVAPRPALRTGARRILDEGDAHRRAQADATSARSRARCAPLPRPHGVALFTRGETQALVYTTLGGAVRRADDRRARRSAARSASICTTTSRRSRSARRACCADPAAARSATATWPSAPSSPCCRRARASPTRCASCPRCSSRTARPRWRPSAARRSR